MYPCPIRARGFTLVELMVVVAILAIVAAIAIPAYTGYVQTARNTEGWNNLNSLKLAEEEYFLESATYFGGTDTAALASYWAPAEAAPEFTYKVTDCDGGQDATKLKTCYAASATGKGGKVPTSVTLTLN